MARSLVDVSPEILIVIETSGRLELANVGRFMQRLDTAGRRLTPKGVRNPRIEIIEITTGSVKIRWVVVATLAAVGSLVFDAGSFAVSVAEYLRSDPAASRSCRLLMEGDNATAIMIEGGGKSVPIQLEDLEPEWLVAAQKAARHPSPPEETPTYEVVQGKQTGFVIHRNGQLWVELDEQPGLIIQLRDQRRPSRPFLEPNFRYTLDGEAYIGERGKESFFVLRDAMKMD